MNEPTKDQQPEAPAATGESAAPSEDAAPIKTDGPNEPRSAPETESPRSPAAPGRGVVLFALVVALAAAGAAAWQWHEQRNRSDALRTDLAQKLAGIERQVQETGTLVRELRQSGGDTRDKLAALENRIAESQGQQVALEQLYQELTRGRDDWAFAEIEQALLIANQQLQLAGNVRAALIALQSADSRLHTMDRPQFTGLRKSLARDIERLKALPHVDVVGLSARIETLIARADELTLAPDARPQAAATAGPAPEGAAGTWERFWRDAWAEVKQLIRVERMDKPALPLMAPDQRFFLRENLKLRLLGARVALLARDEKSFRDDLQAARALLERFFDMGTPAAAQAVASINNLHGTQINVEVPDISATVEAMRNLRLPRERGAR